jgi:hypothetical protein
MSTPQSASRHLDVTKCLFSENYYTHVKYSTPFEYRGVPIVGSVWNPLEDKFE